MRIRSFRKLLSCLVLLLISIPLANADGPLVKIGVIVPLSGDMAVAGLEIREAMTLAIEQQVNTYFRYQLMFEDNALDLKRSVTAAQKLLNIDKVDVIVTLWPPTANVVSPLTETKKVLHYTIAWDPEIARRNKYVLSHQAMVDAYVRATLKLIRDQGSTSLAFFQLNESGFNLGTEFVKKFAPEYGIRITDMVLFNSGQRDFRSEIARAQRQKPDTYLFWAVLPEMEILLKQLKELAPEAEVTGFFDVVTNPTLIQGQEYVSEVSGTAEFAQTFRKRFGHEYQLKAPNAYDISNFLIQAYELDPSRKPDAGDLKKRITSFKNFQGAVGLVSVDDDGNSQYAPIIRVK